MFNEELKSDPKSHSFDYLNLMDGNKQRKRSCLFGILIGMTVKCQIIINDIIKIKRYTQKKLILIY